MGTSLMPRLWPNGPLVRQRLWPSTITVSRAQSSTGSDMNVDVPSFAIVITHNRPQLLADCVKAIRPQVEATVIIDNASEPAVTREDFPVEGNTLALINEPLQPPNLSYLWNLGFDMVKRLHNSPQWNVAVLCDDVMAPDGWVDAVSSCMRSLGAAAGSTHQWREVATPILKQAPDRDLQNRMCGWAFVLTGEKDIRADEDLMWWFCDTSIDFQARQNGGMVICPGPIAHNIHPNDFTTRIPLLAQRSGLDGEVFGRKWGGRPW